jgi:hypothetical protein
MLVLAASIAALKLLVYVWLALRGVLHEDALLYITVGRGILHGYVPYADLFESKPPGIFLLSAASLAIGNSMILGQIASIVAWAGIPVLLFFHSKSLTQGEHTVVRQGAITVFGILLGMYAASRSGVMQTESFGAFFALLFVLLFVNRPLGKLWHSSFLLGLVLLFAVGFKEPFLLSAFAAVLLLEPAWKTILRKGVFSVLSAAVSGFFLLFIFGFLKPFFSIYLPVMFQGHIGYFGSPWIRALMLQKTVVNFWQFSPFFLSIVIFLLAASAYKTWSTATRNAERMRVVLQYALALYLMSFAVGIGGDFYDHHFLFAIPLLAALGVQGTAILRHARWAQWLTVLLLFGTAATAHLPPLRQTTAAWKERRATLERSAKAIDTVLDRCGVPRYLHLVNRAGGVTAFTEHSPLGPLFANHNRFLTEGSTVLQQLFAQSVRRADIIVLKNLKEAGMTDAGKQYLADRFTASAPPCTGTIPDISPYRLLFRSR